MSISTDSVVIDIHGNKEEINKADDTYSAADPRFITKSVKKVLKKSKNKQFQDECKHGVIGRIFFNTVWLTVLALMIFYTYQITIQFFSSSQNPSNTLNYLQENQLPLPEVVICNWNSDNNTSNNITDCPACLELVACTFINTTSDCTSEWKPSFVEALDNGIINNIFHCYTFNDDPTNVTQSVTVAYGGSYDVVFRIQIPNITIAPNPSPTSPRIGLQVTFGVPGTITPYDLYQEYRFAEIGSDTFYSISAINTIRSYLSPDDPNFNITQYLTTSSAVSLVNAFPNSQSGYIGISFAFQTLNLEIISYGYSYTLENFFGDFSGMIGTLMGLDTIKVMAAIPVGWAAIKIRSCKPLEELFNG